MAFEVFGTGPGRGTGEGQTLLPLSCTPITKPPTVPLPGCLPGQGAHSRWPARPRRPRPCARAPWCCRPGSGSGPRVVGGGSKQPRNCERIRSLSACMLRAACVRPCLWGCARSMHACMRRLGASRLAVVTHAGRWVGLSRPGPCLNEQPVARPSDRAAVANDGVRMRLLVVHGQLNQHLRCVRAG